MSLGKRMAAGFNFHFKGLNELQVKLKENANLDLVREAVMLNGSELQKKAMKKSPVDTGYLRRNIALSSDMADRGLSVRVKSNAEYSPYLEYGTRRMYAKPFMKPAYNEQVKQFKADLARLMK
jgi:HK97 gp10 family phage protein